MNMRLITLTVTVSAKATVLIMTILLTACSVAPQKMKPAKPLPVRETAIQTNSALDTLIEQAQQERLVGNMTAAEATLERALRIAPTSAQVYFALAQLMVDQSLYPRALQYAERALSMYPPQPLRSEIECLLHSLPSTL